MNGNGNAAIDQTMPQGKWAFDDDVTAVFDDMLRRSIPDYDDMREGVFSIGLKAAQPDTAIVDLGCSRGEALHPFVEQLGACNRFIGVEISEPMHAAAKARFAGCHNVDIRREDLRHYYPPEPASVVLGVLTVQFTPIEYRQRIIRNVYKSLVPGGVFVLVEKVLGATADLDDLLVDLYYQMKNRNGYTWEQIQRKRLALEGVLVPLTAQGNEELLHSAGFQQVDTFWRDLNFAGFVALKD